MSRLAARIGIVLLLAALFAVRHDVWLWGRSDRILGIPVGLAYHLFFCLLVAGVMGWLVRFAWPKGATESGVRERGGPS